MHESDAPSIPRSPARLLPLSIALMLLASALGGAVAGEPFATWGALAAAALALGLAVLAARSRALTRAYWSTPLDRPIAAGLILCALQCIDAGGSPGAWVWFGDLLSCAFGFYALLPLARRTAGACEAMWSVFAVAAVALGLHALWAASGGLARLGEWSARADAAWASEYGLGKTLVLATLMCAGRALEPGAPPLWRLSAVVGGIGTLLHASIGGLGLRAAPLGLLEHPLYFSVTVVSMLLLASLARRGWQLRRERPEESWRWGAAAAGFTGVAALAVFGGASGGEALRILATLAAVTTLAGAEGLAVQARLTVPPPASETPASKTPAPEAPAPEARRAA